MGAYRASQVFAGLSWLYAALLLWPQLGGGILPWHECDRDTEVVAVFFLLLGLLVWVIGAFAALCERVQRLERQLQDRQQPPNTPPQEGPHL